MPKNLDLEHDGLPLAQLLSDAGIIDAVLQFISRQLPLITNDAIALLWPVLIPYLPRTVRMNRFYNGRIKAI
jgi:hypothetical protein